VVLVLPSKVNVLAVGPRNRWANRGTSGASQQSPMISGGLAWYFREKHTKARADVTILKILSSISSLTSISTRRRTAA